MCEFCNGNPCQPDGQYMEARQVDELDLILPLSPSGVNVQLEIDPLSVSVDDACFNSQASASSALLATLSVSATPQDIVFVTNSDFFQSTSARRLTNGLCCTNNIPPPDDSVGARANAGIRDVKIRIPISVEQPGYFYTTNSFVTANGGTNVGVFESSVGIHCCDGTGDCLGECVDQETTLWGSIISEAGTDESGLNVIRVEQGEYVVVFDWKSSVRRITGACCKDTPGEDSGHIHQQSYMHVRFGAFDLDNDTDNSALSPDYGPDRNLFEEILEKHEIPPSILGRRVQVNNDDDDNDGVLDHLDGFDSDGSQSSDDENLAEDDFVRVALEIPDFVPVDGDFRINFYSNPNPGFFRLWRKRGDQLRTSDDIIFPLGLFTPDYTPQELGFTDTRRVVDFWVEGLAPSTGESVTLEVLLSGFPFGVEMISCNDGGLESVPFEFVD